jgi:DNA polymerase III gamma/tau subunit
MVSLYEKFRPATLDDVVGQPKAVAMLKRITGGGHVLLAGGPPCRAPPRGG